MEPTGENKKVKLKLERHCIITVIKKGCIKINYSFFTKKSARFEFNSDLAKVQNKLYSRSVKLFPPPPQIGKVINQMFIFRQTVQKHPGEPCH